jgi:hypothetical protein
MAKGCGYVTLEEVGTALELEWDNIDDLRSQLWCWDRVYEQYLAAEEVMWEDYGIILTYNIPGFPHLSPVERFHRFIKSRLKELTTGKEVRWVRLLRLFNLTQRPDHGEDRGGPRGGLAERGRGAVCRAVPSLRVPLPHGLHPGHAL